MILILLLLVPLLAGLACWPIRSRPWLERLNPLAFATVAVLAACLGKQVIDHGPLDQLIHGAAQIIQGLP